MASTTAPAATSQTAAAPSIPRFRRSNKPSTLRRRPRSTSPEPAETPDCSTTVIPKPHGRRGHRFGLEVTTAKPGASSDFAPQEYEPDRAAAEAFAAKVVNRFTHQTGQIADVDKHMVAYVESEMQKRRGEVTTGGGQKEREEEGGEEEEEGKGSYWVPTRPEARGATLGKLHEVDLGEEARERNIALTAQALSGGPGTEETHGRKGRQRKRRSSQDIERDRLVEEVLKETRLDLYPEEVDEEDDMDEDGAADDKIAEKFRKEFIDAILTKRRRRGIQQKTKGNKEDKKRPKGPKLGGSRMARAQMREQQTAQASGAGPRK